MYCALSSQCFVATPSSVSHSVSYPHQNIQLIFYVRPYFHKELQINQSSLQEWRILYFGYSPVSNVRFPVAHIQVPSVWCVCCNSVFSLQMSCIHLHVLSRQQFGKLFCRFLFLCPPFRWEYPIILSHEMPFPNQRKKQSIILNQSAETLHWPFIFAELMLVLYVSCEIFLQCRLQ